MVAYAVPLTRLDEMAEASAKAFIGNNDPIGRFLFDEEPNHLELKRRFFRSLVTSCPTKALRLASSERMEAISIWFPPGMIHTMQTLPDTGHLPMVDNPTGVSTTDLAFLKHQQ